MATASFKQHFLDIKRGRPGHRFQDRYQREKRSEHTRSAHGRVWKLGLGILSVVIGLVLCVIPGPGVPFIFLGGGLLAAESLIVARFMDALEVRLRKIAQWALRRWKPLPLWAKAIVGALIVAGGAGSSYVFYRLMAG
jgi:hypothetical protein